jgi:ribonuclease HI
VSSRPKGPDAVKQAADILRILAGKLPDEVLQEHFQDLAPGQVRNILQEAVSILAPRKEEKSKPSPQATLWQDKGKDWKGRLQGKTLSLFTDGASRGNPGEAGAGVCILDEEGGELVAAGQYLGQCTNNEAEYRALLLGLARCKEFGRGRLKAQLDSELIVKQIRGQYRVKHPNLIPLFREAMARLSEFASYAVTHVRREKNSRADELANRAIDEHEK